MKKHDLEYCGIICRHTTLQGCLHPDFKQQRKFNDGKLTREFPEWCPLPDMDLKAEKEAADKVESFYETVRDMRRLQTAYFATRDKGILVASKIREKEVDEAILRFFKIVIDEYFKSKDDHPKLF
jgi:hypothetical protein